MTTPPLQLIFMKRSLTKIDIFTTGGWVEMITVTDRLRKPCQQDIYNFSLHFLISRLLNQGRLPINFRYI